MKNHRTYRLLWTMLAFLVMASYAVAQDAQAYRFDGEEVVFLFDIRNYANALQTSDSLQVDFRDLDVYEVAVSGDIKNWRRKDWRMERTGEFTFELRKAIDEFSDPFPWEFKYLINRKYVAQPDGQLIYPKRYEEDFFKDIFKLDLSTISVSDSGATLFELKGFPNAQEIILSGSFNNWDEEEITMTKTDGGWILRADLPPGRYEYKFIVNGEWMHDPSCPENVTNQHGTLNSVLWITRPVTFNLAGHFEAQHVILSGTFNNWDETALRMERTSDGWTSTLPLPGGKHLYKFIVDGEWVTDPKNELIETTKEGYLNSVLFVH